MANSIHSIRVIDGDTVEAMVAGTDFFKNDYKLLSIRIYGVDTPEKNTLAGKLVKQVVIQTLASYKQPMVIYAAEDKFSGRGVGDILDGPNPTWPTLAKFLIDNELAKPYYGGAKNAWTDKELLEVEKKCTPLLPLHRIGYQNNIDEEVERSSVVYYGTGSVASTVESYFNYVVPEQAPQF
jgi:endonuclease YncB( thermonuclease family)